MPFNKEMDFLKAESLCNNTNHSKKKEPGMDIGSTGAESQTQGSQTHNHTVLFMSDPKIQQTPCIVAAIGTRLLLGGEGGPWVTECGPAVLRVTAQLSQRTRDS